MEWATDCGEGMLEMESDSNMFWQKRRLWGRAICIPLEAFGGRGEADVVESALGKYLTYLASQTNLKMFPFIPLYS